MGDVNRPPAPMAVINSRFKTSSLYLLFLKYLRGFSAIPHANEPSLTCVNAGHGPGTVSPKFFTNPNVKAPFRHTCSWQHKPHPLHGCPIDGFSIIYPEL